MLPSVSAVNKPEHEGETAETSCHDQPRSTYMALHPFSS